MKTNAAAIEYTFASEFLAELLEYKNTAALEVLSLSEKDMPSLSLLEFYRIVRSFSTESTQAKAYALLSSRIFDFINYYSEKQKDEISALLIQYDDLSKFTIKQSEGDDSIFNIVQKSDSSTAAQSVFDSRGRINFAHFMEITKKSRPKAIAAGLAKEDDFVPEKVHGIWGLVFSDYSKKKAQFIYGYGVEVGIENDLLWVTPSGKITLLSEAWKWKNDRFYFHMNGRISVATSHDILYPWDYPRRYELKTEIPSKDRQHLLDRILSERGAIFFKHRVAFSQIFHNLADFNKQNSREKSTYDGFAFHSPIRELDNDDDSLFDRIEKHIYSDIAPQDFIEARSLSTGATILLLRVHDPSLSELGYLYLSPVRGILPLEKISVAQHGSQFEIENGGLLELRVTEFEVFAKHSAHISFPNGFTSASAYELSQSSNFVLARAAYAFRSALERTDMSFDLRESHLSFMRSADGNSLIVGGSVKLRRMTRGSGAPYWKGEAFVMDLQSGELMVGEREIKAHYGDNFIETGAIRSLPSSANVQPKLLD